MAQMTLRKLDDELYRQLKIRAAKNGRSAEAEARKILKDVLDRSSSDQAKEEWIRRAEAFAKSIGPLGVDSTTIIREERDRRAGRTSDDD